MAQQTFNGTKICVEFEESPSRQQLNSGENISTLFGKIKKIFSDLKAVCFSGSYNDLSDTPSTATTSTDGLMSASDKTKLDSADNKYALKSKYGNTTINVGRESGTTVGAYSTAEGNSTTASGSFSHAEGLITIASGIGTHTEGRLTQASGDDSHAGGYSAIASGKRSFSHGNQAKTTHDDEIAFGRFNESNDDTLFSIGDGTAEDARHNAFEITTTGGKLHDKDIATIDDIPTSLPADGGNADYATNAGNANTIAGKPIDNIFHSATINAVNDIDNTDGNWSTDFVTAWSPIAGTFPDGVYDRWFSVRQYQTSATKDFKIQFLQTIESLPRMWHRCKQHEGVWTNWQEIYTSVNKPYIVGSATVTAYSSVCVSEHGFTPSAVLWWENTGTVYSATSFDTTSFNMAIAASGDRTINYIIFK